MNTRAARACFEARLLKPEGGSGARLRIYQPLLPGERYVVCGHHSPNHIVLPPSVVLRLGGGVRMGVRSWSVERKPATAPEPEPGASA